MKWFYKLAAACAAAASLSACATTYTITPVPTSGQAVRYDRGTPTVTSVKPNGAVMVTALGIHPETKRLNLGVAALNNRSQPSNFGYENLSMATADGRPIRLFTKQQLERQAKKQAQMLAIATALSGAANAYAAQQSAYSTTTGTVYSGGRVANYQATTYNPGLANALGEANAEQTSNQLGAIRASLDASIAGIRGNILDTSTLDQGQTYGGQVVADKEAWGAKPTRVTLKVDFNGEEHDFAFDVTAAGE